MSLMRRVIQWLSSGELTPEETASFGRGSAEGGGLLHPVAALPKSTVDTPSNQASPSSLD